jgi:hypothetical protein
MPTERNVRRLSRFPDDFGLLAWTVRRIGTHDDVRLTGYNVGELIVALMLSPAETAARSIDARPDA